MIKEKNKQANPSHFSSFLLSLLQAQILEFGLAVHEKVVPQDMRPLHKKLVDQFFVMKSSLGIQVHKQVHGLINQEI